MLPKPENIFDVEHCKDASATGKQDGGPAFPSHGSMGEVAQQGMSLRDYFAAHTPAEYLAVITEQIQAAGEKEAPVSAIMAAAAFMYADAMLAERAKP